MLWGIGWRTRRPPFLRRLPLPSEAPKCRNTRENQKSDAMACCMLLYCVLSCGSVFEGYYCGNVEGLESPLNLGPRSTGLHATGTQPGRPPWSGSSRLIGLRFPPFRPITPVFLKPLCWMVSRRVCRTSPRSGNKLICLPDLPQPHRCGESSAPIRVSLLLLMAHRWWLRSSEGSLRLWNRPEPNDKNSARSGDGRLSTWEGYRTGRAGGRRCPSMCNIAQQ